ncbi:protein SOSEKI 3-like isoform X2 [Musa acuminata AAA Group]|uniref:protein SOSEKI 3-like isoform X2 n=1 Tax=Musa acuminata AAA Group TaxID=214697 RepID=UPI0031D9DF99
MKQTEGRMRRYGSQSSPERTRPRTEPPPPPVPQQGRKVPVVYYLCKNRHLEHPHFIEVLLSSPRGLYLKGPLKSMHAVEWMNWFACVRCFLFVGFRSCWFWDIDADVIERLNALRGKRMAAMYSWSCKRGYKNGFVWHDLGEDDLVLPAHGNEYVLKGSELLDQSPPVRRHNEMSNPRLQIQNQRESPVNSCKDHEEAASSSSSVAVVVKEAKTSPGLRSPASPHPPATTRPDELSPTTNRSSSSGDFSPETGCRTTPSSAMGSPSPAEHHVRRPAVVQDASTQTDEQGGRKACGIAGVSLGKESRETQNGMSPCPTEGPENVEASSNAAAACSCGRTSTLESLIRDEPSQRKDLRIVEDEVFIPSRAKLKAADMLVQLITCGSISVKDHYNFGIVPTYNPRFTTTMKSPSPTFPGSMMLGEIDCFSESQRVVGLRPEEQINLAETIRESNQEEMEAESCKMPDSRKDEEEGTDSLQFKCLPRAIRIASCKQSKIETVRSPASGTRMLSWGFDIAKSSPLCSSKDGSKWITDTSSTKGSFTGFESFREERKEKVIELDESLLLELGL